MAKSVPDVKNSNQLLFIELFMYPRMMQHARTPSFSAAIEKAKKRDPKYLAIIKDPVDFGVIKDRLMKGWYNTADECINDFITMFRNCDTYFRPDSEVCVSACMLHLFMNRELRCMPKLEFDVDADTGMAGIIEDPEKNAEAAGSSTGEAEACPVEKSKSESDPPEARGEKIPILNPKIRGKQTPMLNPDTYELQAPILNPQASGQQDTNPEANEPKKPKLNPEISEPQNLKMNPATSSLQIPVLNPETNGLQNQLLNSKTSEMQNPKLIPQASGQQKPVPNPQTGGPSNPVLNPETSGPQNPTVNPETSRPQIAMLNPETSGPQIAMLNPQASGPQNEMLKPRTSKVQNPALNPRTNVLQNPLLDPGTNIWQNPLLNPRASELRNSTQNPRTRTPQSRMFVPETDRSLNLRTGELQNPTLSSQASELRNSFLNPPTGRLQGPMPDSESDRSQNPLLNPRASGPRNPTLNPRTSGRQTPLLNPGTDDLQNPFLNLRFNELQRPMLHPQIDEYFLQNYGLHPRGQHNPVLSPQLTELHNPLMNPRISGLLGPALNSSTRGPQDSMQNPRTRGLLGPALNSSTRGPQDSMQNPRTRGLQGPALNSSTRGPQDSMQNPRTRGLQNLMVDPESNGLQNPMLNREASELRNAALNPQLQNPMPNPGASGLQIPVINPRITEFQYQMLIPRTSELQNPVGDPETDDSQISGLESVMLTTRGRRLQSSRLRGPQGPMPSQEQERKMEARGASSMANSRGEPGTYPRDDEQRRTQENIDLRKNNEYFVQPTKPGKTSNSLMYFGNVISALLAHTDTKKFEHFLKIGITLLKTNEVEPVADLRAIQNRLWNNYYGCIQDCLVDVGRLFLFYFNFFNGNDEATHYGNLVHAYAKTLCDLMPEEEHEVTTVYKRNGEEVRQRPRGRLYERSDLRLLTSIRKTTNQLIYIREKVMPKLMASERSLAFKTAVDPVRDNEPDYLKVIKKPMDLGLIKDRLTFNIYSSSLECIQDVQLVFSNCYLYYGTTQEISFGAFYLERLFFENLLLMPKQETTEEALPEVPSSSEVSDLHDDTENQRFAEPDKSRSASEDAVLVSSIHRVGSTKRPLSKSMEYCQHIMKVLLDHEVFRLAESLKKPPSAKPDDRDGIESLFLSFILIRDGIASGLHISANGFAQEVRLQFSKCYQCNPHDSKVVADAFSLQKSFELLYARMPSEDELKDAFMPPRCAIPRSKAPAQTIGGEMLIGRFVELENEDPRTSGTETEPRGDMPPTDVLNHIVRDYYKLSDEQRCDVIKIIVSEEKWEMLGDPADTWYLSKMKPSTVQNLIFYFRSEERKKARVTFGGSRH